MNFPAVVETERLHLRAPQLDDAVEIFRAYGQDGSVARYMVWRPHTELTQTEEFIAGHWLRAEKARMGERVHAGGPMRTRFSRLPLGVYFSSSGNVRRRRLCLFRNT